MKRPLAALGLAAPLALASAVVAQTGTTTTPCPCPRRVEVAQEDCLREARRRVSEAGAEFSVIEAALDGDPVQGARLASLRRKPVRPFHPFEGTWSGRWRDLAVRHAWVSVDERAQLVVVEDAGRKQRGINLRAVDGTICGIVFESNGGERLHIGEALVGPDSVPQLRWQSGNRTYYERVVPDGSGALGYEIVEMVTSEDPPRLGVVTRYRRYAPEQS